MKGGDGVYASLEQLLALRAQAANFSLRPKTPLNTVFAGKHNALARGRGFNFEELRHYRVGDDIRSLDWKVTHRTRKPHVRVHTEDRERNILLLVDQRSSMFFGSQKMKAVAALELAALTAWKGLSSSDRVGAIVFNDTELAPFKPTRNVDAVSDMLGRAVALNHQLSAQAANPHGQNLAAVVSAAQQQCHHSCLVVLISDLAGLGAAAQRGLQQLSQRNDVIIGAVQDALESALPSTAAGLSVRGGDQLLPLRPLSRAKLAGFFQQRQARRERLFQDFAQFGIAVVGVDAAQPVAQQFLQGHAGEVL